MIHQPLVLPFKTLQCRYLRTNCYKTNMPIWTIGKCLLFFKSGRKWASLLLVAIFVANCLLVGVIRSRLMSPVGAELRSKPDYSYPNSRRPMVLSLKYWEQTTNAIKNLFDLQCWASSVHIDEVVEPTIYSTADDGNGILRFDTENKVSFRDYFDLDYWNKLTSKQGYSVLVSFQNFLYNASREMVFVQIRYKENSPLCKSLEQLKESFWVRFLKSYGFKISTECVSAYLSIENNHFWQQIFGPSSSIGSKTIMFEEWRGISLNRIFRLQLKNSQCKGLYERSMPKKISFFKDNNNNSFPSFSFIFSDKILSVLEKFISKYLFGRKYITVMLRAEKMNSSIFSVQPDNNLCMKNIISDHRKCLANIKDKENTKIDLLFFSDYGPHGSLSWIRRKDWSESAGSFSHYLEQVLQPLYNQGEFNKMLEGVAESNDSVVLSLLQSGIAAKSEAIILVGGGSFQQYIWTKYSLSQKHDEIYLLRNWQCAQMNL